MKYQNFSLRAVKKLVFAFSCEDIGVTKSLGYLENDKQNTFLIILINYRSLLYNTNVRLFPFTKKSNPHRAQ